MSDYKIDTLEVETQIIAPAATTTVAGLQSPTDKTKLDSVESGATANDTDANLRDRSTHTGTQTASTISDFNAAASTAAPVQSVAGKTGTVTLDKNDVGLSNVDNTSDLDKVISTATQTALDLKQPLDGDLTAIAALAGAGFAVRTTTNTWATRSLTTPVGSGLAITNQDGVFGSPAFTNTDKGSTAVSTHEAASDPHPQYETSAEAQAKVDAHATLTNNPHGVTATQVGAYTTAQTDTLVSGKADTIHTHVVADITDAGALASLNTVGTAQIDANAVTSTQIANNAVTSAKINNNVVTNAKLTDMPADTIKGRLATTGDPTDLTVLQVRTLLSIDQVDNTSDLNKPISTATQTALNLKYDASNPNGYETPSQLNTRDTNNRARANHTGNQLASTISDFADTVRSTVLTGLSTATNAVIDATDTVLSALGKLQKQLSDAVNSVNATLAVINGRLDALEAEVFGENYQYFTDITSSTTTSGAQPLTAVASSFTTASVPAGIYRIGIQYHWTNNSVTADSRFALFVDGVQIGNQHNEECQDNTSNKNDQIIGNVTLGAGTHTIELRFGSEALITTTVNRVDCEFWRVS